MRRQHELWPELDPEASHLRWLRLLSPEQLVLHAKLFAETPGEQALAEALEDAIDYPPECQECADREEAGMLDDEVFSPLFPPGLDPKREYVLPCDDKGRLGGSWLKVGIQPDGDAYVVMQDWEDPSEGQPNLIPTLRCRTFQGGGRHGRTHQALLWLARAIQLDNEEINRGREHSNPPAPAPQAKAGSGSPEGHEPAPVEAGGQDDSPEGEVPGDARPAPGP